MRIDKNTIFMTYPSTWWHDLWREGLVAGNGCIGANVYGGVKEETTMIAHGDLWHNGHQDNLPDVSDSFQKQRAMMDAEQFKEASWEVVNALKEKGYGSVLESQLPVADFKVIIQPIKGFSEYIRGTHMDTGEVGCEWRDGESLRTSYLFVSRKRDVIVKRITSTSPDLEMTFGMDIHYNTTRDSAEKYAKHVLETKECSVRDSFINYTALNDDGTLYGTDAQICPADGIWEENHGKIKLSQCSEVLIFIKPFIKACKEQKNTVLAKLQKELSEIPADYDSLLKEHARLHKKWYNSADFSLNYRGKYHSNEQLLAEAYSGKQSPELIEKLWKYGRYLFISGTSDKDNPFPLYGLWAGDYRLMWSHNMANENTEMIYWHSYVGNLLPFQKGLYKYYNNRIPEYRDNAKKLFGMNGIYMTAGTTPGVCKPTQVVPVIINWVGAAGWIAEHYCNYYWYTRDEKYLQKVILPYLEEVAAFYEDFIEFYPDGSIHFYPSVSPENTPGNFMPPPEKQMAHPMPTTVNSTIDLAIVKEFFTNMCRLAEEKNLYQDRVAAWKKILDSIPDYQESKDGGIKEWMDSRFDERYDHRHLSHIYPVFPSVEVNSLHKKDLLPLFKRSVELRKIDAQTGWSMAHMASIYARLEDGRNAIECLNNMAKTSLTNNFFSLHNDWRGMNVSLCMDPAPVQLDAVVGYVNAIQEMLVYSSEELVKLLPALSDELKKGSVKDFRYVNGMLNMQWDVQKNSFCAVLKAERAHKLWIQLPKEFTGYQFETTDCSIKRDGELFCLEMGKQATIKITV